MEAIDRRKFRERLTEGETVYFVEKNNLDNSFTADAELRVKQGSVEAVDLSKRYQSVAIWDRHDKRPTGSWVSVLKSPRELFTAKEVEIVISSHPVLQGREVNVLIQEKHTNRKLATALFGVFIERMGDDLENRPFDPER